MDAVGRPLFSGCSDKQANMCHRTNWILSQMTPAFVFTLPSTVKTSSFVSVRKDDIREMPLAMCEKQLAFLA